MLLWFFFSLCLHAVFFAQKLLHAYDKYDLKKDS
jgi:hypothetical protein